MKATKMLTSKKSSSWITAMVVMLLACQKDSEILNSVDTQNVNSEAASSAYVSENADISAIVMSNLTTTQYSSGRSEVEFLPNLGTIDSRLKCAKVSITSASTSTKLDPAGTITIDYDSLKDCVDDHNVARKGKIIIMYSGRRWQNGSTYSIQLKNFYRNGAHIEGTENYTTGISADSLHLQFTSSLVGGKITFVDGRSIERDHTFTKTWYRSSNPKEPANDEWHIEGTATGTCKNGNTFMMQVQQTSPLIQRFFCWSKYKIYIPVKGVKIITVTSSTDSKTYQVDYGDGTCDNLVIVTVNGKEKVISVNGDGN